MLKIRVGRARINNFFHVILCVWYVDGLPKYEVQDTHEDNVTTQEDQHWVVALVRTPRIWVEYQDKKPAEYLEQVWQEKDATIEKGGQVPVQSSSFQSGVVVRETPSQRYDGLKKIEHIIKFKSNH